MLRGAQGTAVARKECPGFRSRLSRLARGMIRGHGTGVAAPPGCRIPILPDPELPIMRLALSTVLLVLSAGLAHAGSGVNAFPPAPAPLTSPVPAAAQPKATTTPPHARPVTTPGLSEPKLKLAKIQGSAGRTGPRVALTFDACSGKTDQRIFSTLVENRIPATIFATARWIRHNPDAVAVLKANPDLFEVENHGAMHVPAVDKPAMVYGIPAAGSPEAVTAEVTGGANAIEAAGFAAPHWFRGATARYNSGAMAEISGLGFRVAGYSLNGDDGASVSAATAEKRLSGAKDGSVIIAHINQPDRPAGEGVARGILALKARGAFFVKLSDAAEEPVTAAVR